MENTTSIDIVDLIENNPISKINITCKSKLIEKIQSKFTTYEQQLFLSSFYCYLKYDKINDYVIDLDNVWKWLGFSTKGHSKYLLEKGLKPNKAPFHPILKWIIIGFLGTLIILTLFSSVVIWKLHPTLTMYDNIGYLDLMDGTLKVRFNIKNEHDTSVYFSSPSQNLLNDKKKEDSKHNEIKN